jgi:hypothetical protein
MDLVKPQICENYEESGNGYCSNCVHDKPCHTTNDDDLNQTEVKYDNQQK